MAYEAPPFNYLNFFSLMHLTIIPPCAIVFALWNSDKFISAYGAKTFYEEIKNAAISPENSRINYLIEKLIVKYFSLDKGPWIFIGKVGLLTSISLTVMLGIYCYRMPDLVPQLLTKGFLSQFFGNGFVVVFFINFFSFALYGHILKFISASSLLVNFFVVLLEIFFKALLFILWSSLTYIAFAVFGDAFLGNPKSAINAIPITILNAIQFNNLTSVYIYSLAMSSFPIFIGIILKCMVANESFRKVVFIALRWLPFEDKPLRAISVIFALSAGLFILVLSLLLVPVR